MPPRLASSAAASATRRLANADCITARMRSASARATAACVLVSARCRSFTVACAASSLSTSWGALAYVLRRSRSLPSAVFTVSRIRLPLRWRYIACRELPDLVVQAIELPGRGGDLPVCTSRRGIGGGPRGLGGVDPRGERQHLEPRQRPGCPARTGGAAAAAAGCRSTPRTPHAPCPAGPWSVRGRCRRAGPDPVVAAGRSSVVVPGTVVLVVVLVLDDGGVVDDGGSAHRGLGNRGLRDGDCTERRRGQRDDPHQQQQPARRPAPAHRISAAGRTQPPARTRPEGFTGVRPVLRTP